MLQHFVASITRNGTSLAGTALALASLVLMICLFVMELLGFEGGPYLGILIYLILPLFFVLGLILIPVGVIIHRSKMRRHPKSKDFPLLPVFDLNSPKTRGWVLVFVGATVINVVILAGATYKGLEVMESNRFCGAVCHSVMEPEYTAYEHSSHSRVACVECHIGPGADWFIKSKINGAWQVISVAFDLYQRPIPTPIPHQRPAEEICEQCHWPTRFVGDKLRVSKSYRDDENNTELTTALLLKVGGVEGKRSEGIHWHVDPDVKIRYRSDETRQEIYEVEVTNGSGGTKTFKDRKAPESGGVWRTMDCLDCHNRPSHVFQSPEREIDEAIRLGTVNRSLPFVKREAMRIVNAEFASHDEARSSISQQLGDYYQEKFPEIADQRSDDIEAAGRALGDIYAANVFPRMKIWWDTYPDHIGHEQSPGCYRCHSKTMRTEDREHISKECEICHVVYAEKEEDPKILADLQPPE